VPGQSPVLVRRPKAIVFDILGTASKSGFLERILFPYLKVNLEPYVSTHWTKRDFLKLYARIVEQSVEFNRNDPSCPIVAPHDRDDARTTLVNFINYVTETGLSSPAVTQLRFKVWFEGYQSARIKTPVYSDVPNRMRTWFAEGVKFYVFSNTWTEAQQALLKNTNHGDMTTMIAGHYDNDFGQLTSVESWRKLCDKIKQQPNDVLFLTKSVQEASAAQEAGLCVVLVLTHRHNVRAISHEDRQRFPYVRTLNDLSWIDGAGAPSGSLAPSGPAGPSSGISHAETKRTKMSQVASSQQSVATGATSASVATGATSGVSSAATQKDGSSVSGNKAGAK